MKNIYNIEDIDLNDKEVLEVCMRNWYTIEELAEVHVKALDLMIEMKDRWKKSNLSQRQKILLKSSVIDGDKKIETSKDFNFLIDDIDSEVEAGLELLCKVGRI